MRWVTLLLLTLTTTSCSQAAWDTAGKVIDALPDTSSQGQCESLGGQYTEVSSYNNGKIVSVHYECRIEKGTTR